MLASRCKAATFEIVAKQSPSYLLSLKQVLGIFSGLITAKGTLVKTYKIDYNSIISGAEVLPTII